MTYTQTEHLNNFPIIDEDIFMLFEIYNNRFNNLKNIGRWFKMNPSTCFRYIHGQLKDNRHNLNLDRLKLLYPNVRFITTIDNPWYHLYNIYITHPTFSKMLLANFIKIASVHYQYRRNLLDFYPPDKSIIFLRNEYIASDFSIFSKSSNILFQDPDPVDYRTFFDDKSNDIICSIFQKDIEFFYPELLC